MVMKKFHDSMNRKWLSACMVLALASTALASEYVQPGELLITTYWDQHVLHYDLNGDPIGTQPFMTLATGDLRTDGIVFSPDGTKFYVATIDDVPSSKARRLRSFSAITGADLGDAAPANIFGTLPLDILPDGRMLGINPATTEAFVYDLDTQVRDVILTAPDNQTGLYGIAANPVNGNVYIAQQRNHTVKEFALVDGDWVLQQTLGEGGTAGVLYRPYQLSVSPDGQKVFIGTQGQNELIEWEPATGNLRTFSNGNTSYMDSLVGPDGDLYVLHYSSRNSCGLMKFDMDTTNLIWSKTLASDDAVMSIAMRPLAGSEVPEPATLLAGATALISLYGYIRRY